MSRARFAHLLSVTFVYLGFTAALLGMTAGLGSPTRPGAAWLLGSGMVLLLAGWFLPAVEARVEVSRTQLDRFVPAYQFTEFHSIQVAAPKEEVYGAIKAVTADEISLFNTLTWIRRLGRAGPENILNPTLHDPILEVATRTSFVRLSEEPNHEIVVGMAVIAPPGLQCRLTPEQFKALRQPGYALAAMNFLVEDAPSRTTTVTTETRIFATDSSTRRRFAAYWRTIYPGSALLRYTWLRAIKRRAESANSE